MMRCEKCKTKLQTNYIYVNRKRIKCGLFCPLCCAQREFSQEIRDYQDALIKEKKARATARPRFNKKRKPCPYCLNKNPPIINRSKWTIRKMKVKPHESESWKCTCKLCGGIWTQNTGKEYYYYDVNQPKPEEMQGASF